MPSNDTALSKQAISFQGSHNNLMAADIYQTIEGTWEKIALLIHGGGQTRHSWGNTAKDLAAHGWTAITVDQRGHGDSDWTTDGQYGIDAFGDDLKCISQQITDRYGVSPVVIGASLGGLASLIASTKVDADLFKAIILVDITPKMKAEGVDKILGFMSQDAKNGFGSLEEASDTIARYLPKRKKPTNLKGLSKNLRLHDDGRYRWHWDPNFIEAKLQATKQLWDENEKRFQHAASALTVPTLLVRGQQSELVTDEEVADFMSLVPHAHFTDVSDAGHMIAGDKNDAFTVAVMEFLREL